MMEYEVQPTFDDRQVLLVAAPNDLLALKLLEELRVLGLDVILADTDEIAERAKKIAVCVAVLHPGEWNSASAIAVARQSNPRYMVPVLAEPMFLLPDSAWATEPISVKEPLALTARELEKIISSYFALLAESEMAFRERRATTDFLSSTNQASVQVPTYKKIRIWKNIVYKRLSGALVLLFMGALLGYIAPHPANTQVATSKATVNPMSVYIAQVPGNGCDKGKGDWGKVTHNEDAVAASCTSNGLVLAQYANTQYVGDVPFYGIDDTLPANYSVKAQIDISNLHSGCVGLSTREDDHAGAYSFQICLDGTWEIIRYNSKDGEPNVMITGKVEPHSFYTLEALSNGTVEALVLDGTRVGMVNDKTFMTTNHIGLTMAVGEGLDDSTAVFSDFVLTPLP